MPRRLPSAISIRIAMGDRVEDLTVELTDADVSVGELCTALGLPAGVCVDGRPLTAADLAEPAVHRVVDGALIDGGSGRARASPGPPAEPVVEVAVAAGLDAGAQLRVRAGHYRLRSVPGSRRSWFLAVDGPATAGASPRPWHEAAASIEAVGSNGAVLTVGQPVDPQARATGYVHRPPRPLGPAAVDPIELEPPPPAPGEPPALSWATLLAPIPIAVLMAMFFRPLFALFAAMGPIVAIGRWVEGRRRHRCDRRRFDAELARIQLGLAEQRGDRAEAEAKRRWHDHPHVAALWHRAERHSARLWERRPASPAYLHLTIGIGPDELVPELVGARLDPQVHHGAGDPIPLRPVPHAVDLGTDAGLGLHGSRSAALAVARSAILQLATLHGPADLRIGLVAGRDRGADWDWLKWLPHLDSRLVAPTVDPVVDLVAPPHGPSGTGPVLRAVDDSEVGSIVLVVVDDHEADVAAIRRAAIGSATEVRVIAVAARATFLPAICTVLVELDGHRARISTPRIAEGQREITPVGVTVPTAESWARRLAPMRDPELIGPAGSASAEGPSLLRMLGAGEPQSLIERWAARPPDASPVVPVGDGPDGEFSIDVAADGPHALVAGTTGSGKSEFLRTLVVALAASCPPSQLNFVLVDFKGGGAFDVCSRLPHVAGVITDLDESMIERALNSLRAELQRREALLRSLGVSSHEQAVEAGADSIPRLVIVIDEFAALATDHGDLLNSIVDLAARGRSLGMHLVLATQRPSGVVDQKIRANTNLRIALRVQDPHDSLDVVGTPAAAAIDRASPGRAVVSIGGDRPVTVQTAWSGAPDRRRQRCRVVPHRLPLEPPTGPRAVVDAETGPSELDVMLGAITAAAESLGEQARPLWPEPLPELFDWIDLGTRLLAQTDDPDPGLALGLVDLPEHQAQRPWRWDPDTGSLVLYGASAATSGNFLLSVASVLATGETASQTHLYLVDGDAGAISPLAGLPCTGAYVSTSEPDRIDRTIRFVEEELVRRRSCGAGDSPRIVVLIDNVAAVLDAWDDVAALRICDRLAAIARDGSPQRVHVVITARTARDLPHRLAQQLPTRLVASLADPAGYLTLGIASRHVVPLPAMRVIDLTTHRVVQLVQPPDFEDLIASLPAQARRSTPVPIRRFPSEVDATALAPATVVEGTIRIPIGVDAVAVEPADLVLAPGEHALVAGPPGSGRTTCLRSIADRLRNGGVDVELVWIGLTPSAPGSASRSIDRHVDRVDDIADLDGVERPTLVLIDDADRLAPEIASAVEALGRSTNPQLHLVAVAAPDHVRGLRSTTAAIRAGGTGIIVGGSVGDGDLLRVALSRLDGLGRIPGRGHLVSRGRVVPVQLARAPDADLARPSATDDDPRQPSVQAPGAQLW